MRWGILVLLLAMVPSVGSCDDTLTLRLNRFAEEYNRFARRVNHGEFDVAQARRLSKLWAEVERSGYWPSQ